MSGLLDQLIAANGGLPHWQTATSITTTLLFSGPILTLKGYPGWHLLKAHISTREQKVTFESFGALLRGVYTPSRTEFCNLDGTAAGDETLDVREDPRAAFKGHELGTPWDKHHLIYFIGYALWNYFNLPFLLLQPRFDVEELDPFHTDAGEVWRVLRVTFPEDVHTHTKMQKFFFDERFRLRRMDYNAEVVGAGPGSLVRHMCFDHKVFDGLIVPTFRFPQFNGAGASHMTAFTLQIDDVQVHRDHEARI